MAQQPARDVLICCGHGRGAHRGCARSYRLGALRRATGSGQHLHPVGLGLQSGGELVVGMGQSGLAKSVRQPPHDVPPPPVPTIAEISPPTTPIAPPCVAWMLPFRKSPDNVLVVVTCTSTSAGIQ